MILWLYGPEAHDFDAGGEYLKLLSKPADARVTVDAMKTDKTLHKRKAKDILRASGLPLLSAQNIHVAKDLRKVRDGEKLSPILLVRGNALEGIPLQIADGYHRVCAAYLTDENTDIP